MTKRESNIDLFRIVATFYAIILHVLGMGGILEATSPDGMAYWIAWLMEICAYCAVNCFGIITGYVMIDKTIKVKRIMGLWFQVLFYSLLISLVFFFLVPETRTIKNLVITACPVLGSQWWYISSYFALFFFIPLLNAAVNNITKGTYEKFLAVVFVGIGVFSCVIPTDAFKVYGGYSAIWLILLYLFGAYIKKYELKKKTTPTKSLIGFAVVVILTFLSKLIIHLTTKFIFGEAKFDGIFVSYISVTIVLESIFLFLFCLNIKINNAFKKVIVFFAPASLGVYLIHVHPFVFNYLLGDAFVFFAHMPVIIMVLCVLAASLIIFVLCSVIELLRIQLFKLMQVGRLCEMIDHKITYLSVKVFKE